MGYLAISGKMLSLSGKYFYISNIKYGVLYNWYAAADASNIANTGWHVPTSEERDTLITYLGGTTVAGGKLKEQGTTFWTDPNIGATNEVGFNARGAGVRGGTGNYGYINVWTYFWFSDLYNENNGYMIKIQYDSSSVLSSWTTPLTVGFSIRLLKDSTSLSDGESGSYTGNDGKVYRTICIGTQEWLADNLAETKYRNGSTIPEVTLDASWEALTTGALCAYNNNWSNVHY